MDWDNLRFLLATARAGTFSAAASDLGVNRTTVARRISNLEDAAGQTLLTPSNEGLKPTAAGKQLLNTAREMEKNIEQVNEALGKDSAAGPLRVAAPIGLGAEFMPQLTSFCRANPDCELDLLTVANPSLLVSNRQADVALVVTNQPPEHLDGSLICDMQRAPYASSGYLKKLPGDTPLHHHQWVAWGRDMADTLAARWMAAHLPQETSITARVNSWTAMREAVSEGLGVSFLWCFLADEDARLERIRQPEPELSMSLWLVKHADIPANPRVAAFRNSFPELVKQRIETAT